MSNVFSSKRHDTAISPVINLTPPAGVTWDLQTAGTTVRLIARLPTAGSPLKMNGACVVVGPWAIRYDPTPANVDAIGTYDVEVEVLRPDTKKITFPTKGYLSWVIEPDLDNA